jgi:hypothetical protein
MVQPRTNAGVNASDHVMSSRALIFADLRTPRALRKVERLEALFPAARSRAARWPT